MTSPRKAPVDGGWGWIVVFSSYYFHLATGGAVYGLSVFYNSWVEDFKASRGLTAWVLILVMAVSMASGPAVASICNKFGYRPVVIVGALMLSAGFFGSYFAQSVYVLIGLIGLLGGFGFGLQYLPCVAMIPLYFEKKRSFATGLATSGVGLGTFIFPPILTWLEECYTWRGAMLIISGLFLQMVVCGALLRPMDIEDEEEEEECDQFKELYDAVESHVEHDADFEVDGRPNGTVTCNGSTQYKSGRLTKKNSELLEHQDVCATEPYEIKIERVLSADSETPHKDYMAVPMNGNNVNVYEIRVSCLDNIEITKINTTEYVSRCENKYQSEIPSDTLAGQSGNTSNQSPPSIIGLSGAMNIEDTNRGQNCPPLQGTGHKHISADAIHTKAERVQFRPSSHLQHPAIERVRGTTKSLGGSFQQLRPTAASKRFSSVHDICLIPPSKNSALHKESSNSTHKHFIFKASSKNLHGRSYVDVLLANSIINLEKAEHSHRSLIGEAQCNHSLSVANSIGHSSLLTQSPQVSRKQSLNTSASESHNSVHMFIDSFSCSNHKQPATSETANHCTPSHDSKCFPDSPAIISKNLDLLLDPRFGIFAFANFLACFTYLVPVVYIVDRGIDQGLEKTQAALAFSMYGAGNLFGRISTGLAADAFRLDCLTFEACLLMVCGISTCLSTLCGASIILHGIYGLVFGTCIGGFVTLTPVILVEMLGLAKVSQSYGLLLFFQASGFIAGTPMGGFIYDATNSYTLSFLINGSVMGLSGVVLIILKLTLLRPQKLLAADVDKVIDDFEVDESDVDTDKDVNN